MKRMLSGIKPSGKVTLGNYIGAIRNFVNYQDEYELFIFIANMHAITVPQNKEELKRNTLDLALLYVACGLDPNKTTLFVQSDVLEHANLGFVMNCNSYMGELSRMTQYKAKVAENKNNSSTVGLFTYPCLMAADILLYDPDFIPVGDDQKQHVELTRDLANRFNERYGETFTVPEPITGKVGTRIMSLQDPTKKMSKSDDEFDKGCIYLLDDPSAARNKILRAVTDSGCEIIFDPKNKPGISNLLQIYSSLTNISINDLEEKYKDANYGTFKKDLGDIVYNLLLDIQIKYKEIKESKQIYAILEEGAKKASYLARKKLNKVYKKIGFTY